MTPQQQHEAGKGVSLGLSLSRHLMNQERAVADFGGMAVLLNQAAYAGKLLAREVGRAALVGSLGLIGDKNATGDSQKKLDVYSNDIAVEAFKETGLVAAIVSEELEHMLPLEGCESAPYILAMDPLDGSSNTDINGSLGTIFGVFKRKATGAPTLGEFSREGSELAMAGYVMYSTSTLLVYTTGHGVYGFTLDRDLGEYLLSHDKITCPKAGKTYAANVAHYPEWSPNIQKYVDSLMENSPGHPPHSLRYTGALVADVHRCLVEGGLYFYPSDPGHRKGKLRLMYECAPLAFIVEQAGGSASNGMQRILDVKPGSIHERMPLAIGSADDVALYDKFFLDGRA